MECGLANSAYNACQDECKATAYSLKALAGMPHEQFKDTRLRDVPVTVYEQYDDRPPAAWKRRAEHYYTEQARARLARKHGARATWLNMAD